MSKNSLCVNEIFIKLIFDNYSYNFKRKSVKNLKFSPSSNNIFIHIWKKLTILWVKHRTLKIPSLIKLKVTITEITFHHWLKNSHSLDILHTIKSYHIERCTLLDGEVYIQQESWKIYYRFRLHNLHNV